MTADWPVRRFDEIDSTSEEAKRQAVAGAAGPVWITARSQASGRGRLGRSWVSPPGNLYASALFPMPGGAKAAVQIPFVAGLAAADVFAVLAPDAEVRLKWPNDVRAQERKLCGVLVEAGEGPAGPWCVTGIGMNVAFAPEAAGQAAASLADLRGDEAVSADMAFEALREAFARRLNQLDQGFESVRKDWLARAEGLSQRVTVSVGGRAVEGVFETLAPDGGLVMRLADGSPYTVRAGDVELVKEVV